jgi:hypothetical protein
MSPETPQEQTGRSMLYACMGVGIVFELLRFGYTVLTGQDVVVSMDDSGLVFGILFGLGLLLRLGLLLLLFVQAIQGKSWARIALGVVYVAGALFLIDDLVQRIDGMTIATIAVFALLGVVVLFAPPIRAYVAGVCDGKDR